MGLRIPMARAEKLKMEEGSVILGNCLPGETVLLKDDSGFAGKEIERETLNTIIHLRLRETLRAAQAQARRRIVHQLHRRRNFHHRRLQPSHGIDHLAERDFRNAGARFACANDVRPNVVHFENPQFSTAIGLIKYAQAVQSDRGRPRRGFGRISRKIFNSAR